MKLWGAGSGRGAPAERGTPGSQRRRGRLRAGQALAAAMVALVVLAACGQDEGAGVREIGDSETGTGTGTGTGTEASEAAKCEPVGDASKATATVNVKLQEWSLTPDVTEVKAGTVAFKLQNGGKESHEMMVVRADDPAALPVDVDGAFDEKAAPAGSVVGEVEKFPAGEGCEGTFDLTPGGYVLLCNVVESEGGKVESHYKFGMRTPFKVT